MAKKEKSSKKEIIDMTEKKSQIFKKEIAGETKREKQFSKRKILLPYIVFIVSLLISTLLLYFNNSPKTNQSANNAVVKRDTVFINQISNKKDTVIAVNSLKEFIRSTTTSANQYLQETTVYDIVKMEDYLKQLKQLYSIKGLSDYENGILNVLIAEYEKQIKNKKISDKKTNKITCT